MNALNGFGCGAALVLAVCGAAFGHTTDSISEMLQAHQRDLATDGKAFLLYEASRASFILVGGLHGDQETPALVQTLTAGSEQFGYTLGNFIGELAIAEGVQSFHVVLFAAGGKYSLRGLHDIDQRKDEQAFAFLASLARYPAAVFDLRPIRQSLHNLPAPLTPRDTSLLYWADSYDAIICYREVTPLGGVPPK